MSYKLELFNDDGDLLSDLYGDCLQIFKQLAVMYKNDFEFEPDEEKAMELLLKNDSGRYNLNAFLEQLLDLGIVEDYYLSEDCYYQSECEEEDTDMDGEEED